MNESGSAARPTTRPANLSHGVDDLPPTWLSVTLALQHVIIISVGMAFPVLLAGAMKLGHAQTACLVRVSLLAAGIGTLLQTLRRGPLGSGFLCPEGPDPSFLPACLLAGTKGGLPLVFGMTALAGAFEAALAPVMYRLRALFPPEVTGVVVAMVGIGVLPSAGANLLGSGSDGSAGLQPTHLLIGLAALASMVATSLWSRGSLRRYSILVGMAVGYGGAWAVGLLTASHWGEVAEAPLLALPIMPNLAWSFDAGMILPFLIAVICSTLKNVGDITTCQKVNSADWKRVDMHTVRGGILADAASTFLGGAMGGYGPASYSANVGLSVATGVTSRRVGQFAGAICIGLAFCPKLAALFAIMPRPLIGALILFCVSFMILAGLQIIMSRMMDVRRTFLVGLSFAFGLMAGFLPDSFRSVPGWLQPLFASVLSVATVSAMAMNLLFRLGSSASAGVDLPAGDGAIPVAWRFLDEQGQRWGAQAEVIRRASAAVAELLEQVIVGRRAVGFARLQARFDETNLDIELLYDGEPMELPTVAPAVADAADQEQAFRALSGYLARTHADRVHADTHAGHQRVTLHYDQ